MPETFYRILPTGTAPLVNSFTRINKKQYHANCFFTVAVFVNLISHLRSCTANFYFTIPFSNFLITNFSYKFKSVYGCRIIDLAGQTDSYEGPVPGNYNLFPTYNSLIFTGITYDAITAPFADSADYLVINSALLNDLSVNYSDYSILNFFDSENNIINNKFNFFTSNNSNNFLVKIFLTTGAGDLVATYTSLKYYILTQYLQSQATLYLPAGYRWEALYYRTYINFSFEIHAI